MRRLLAALGLASATSAATVAFLLARRRAHLRALDRLLSAAELRRTVEHLQQDLPARGPAAGPPAASVTGDDARTAPV